MEALEPAKETILVDNYRVQQQKATVEHCIPTDLTECLFKYQGQGLIGMFSMFGRTGAPTK